MGLGPSDGKQFGSLTTGWSHVASEHLITFVLTRDMEREAQGLPREPPEVRAEIIERAAQRELAISLLGDYEEDVGFASKVTEHLRLQALANRWNATAQGAQEPVTVDNVLEKLEAFRELSHVTAE